METADALPGSLPDQSLAARATRWLPRLLWALAVAQVLGGLLLAWLNRLTLTRVFAEYLVASGAAALGFATVGMLIVARRPANTIGWLLCAIGVVAGLGAWTGQYARYTYVTNPGALPLGPLVAWLYISWSFGLFVGLTAIVLPLLYPNGRLPSPRWRPVAWLAGLAIALFSAMLAVSPGPVDASLPEVANPFAPPALAPALRLASPVSVGLMLASFGAALAAPVLRFRNVIGAERQQLKWFAYAIALLVAAIVLPAALVFPNFTTDTLLSGILLALAYSFLPAAIGVAILRYRLYDIDVLINRTLVYGVLSAGVAGLYVVVVGYVGALFHARGDVWVSLLATGVVAVLFQPLRARVQQAVNQLMFGKRDDPYAALAQLGQRLEVAIDPELVLPTIARTIGETLKLPYVTVALGPDAQASTLAEYRAGDARGPADGLARWPLVYQGQAIGELRLAPRAGESELAAADRRLLGDLARQAGVAAHAVRLTLDLQRARERLVLAREEERRRLRRDLHDGLGPALAGMTLKIDTAHDELYTDREYAASLLRELKADVKESIADIRRLVYALRPPALDELGLLAALQLQLAQFQSPQLRVVLDAPASLPALPAALEVAAYRIVAEALTNVVKHARAGQCHVRLAIGSALEIEVCDDGAGIAPGQPPGVGLVSMRERAEELGGWCSADPAPGGGTCVRAHLPLR